jgi:8-oxo-dGTP pyrophosphatase MutT (NUDIX family)
MLNDLVREFTVAVFVVHQRRVLLLLHPKLGRWLPPGGHIEPNELPDEAAVREVEEETGVRIRLVGGQGLPIDEPRQLVRPAGIQLENIGPGHQHIDLVYFAVPEDGGHEVALHCAQEVGAAWFGLDQLDALGANGEIQAWCRRALQEVEIEPTDLPLAPAGGILLNKSD